MFTKLGMSTRQVKSQIVIGKLKRLLSSEESNRSIDNQLEWVDETLTLKTHVKQGEEVTILSASVNKEVRKGIVDFQDGNLARFDGAGSMVVDKIRISHAIGNQGEDAAEKSYKTNDMPTDIENAVIRIEQGGKLVIELKASRFKLRGDEAGKLGDDFLEIDSPITFIAGSPLTIKVLRPDISGKECFLGIEFEGKKTMPKRA